MAQGLAKPLEILRHDSARIAPGAVKRTLGNQIHDFIEIGVRPVPQRVQDRLERERHVGAGVPVGDRENIDAVDIVPVQEQVSDAGAKRAGQPWTVQIGDGNSVMHGQVSY